MCNVKVIKTYLFEFINDHGEGFKNGSGGPCQGDDTLRAVPFRDVNASSALKRRRVKREAASYHRYGYGSTIQWKYSCAVMNFQ